MSSNPKGPGILSLPVIAAALGYFVDIYDLLLFNILRIKSLGDLGLSTEEIDTKGEWILGLQMAGLLTGGIIWGILGDKKGRLRVLFGSIVIYSVANVATGFVQNAEQYALARFIAGIGLAGELGAGITLVSELLRKEIRGIATSFVAALGILGAVVAFYISQHYHWRTCYFIGGGLGLALLLLRIGVFESGMYNAMHANVSKGNFFKFFTDTHRFKKYLHSILLGLPTWYIVGILIAFSNKFGKDMGITADVDPGRATMYAYIALSVGDILAGLISQLLRSRKKTLYIYYALSAVMLAAYFLQSPGESAQTMYLICWGLGFSAGFWAIFVTMGAEQFGTNLRATAATTIPNMVRGALPLMLLLFNALQHWFSFVQSGWITGIIVLAISAYSASQVEETFSKDLDYLEE